MMQSEVTSKYLGRNLISQEGEEEINQEEYFSGKDPEEKYPLQDILANERRTYTAEQEYVYKIYNDILGFFVIEWESKLLRKTVIPKDSQAELGENEKGEEDSMYEYFLDKSQEACEKLKLRDEQAEVEFINNNTYSGRISRKMMEGDGIYTWREGVSYKGKFEANQMTGEGFLEWKDDRWYEGEILNGYRHGKGTMVDRDYHRLYIGEWYLGRKHGKGYCRYEKGDTYDGDWVSGKREGAGLRIYPSGARYVGQWKNNFRHGIGTMAWPNGDVYRGEWKDGEMHGYGEYMWRSFFNKELCWPQETCYIGEWQSGMRHGKGLLKLGSPGGAKFSGEWKEDAKHGYGLIIGNNGAFTEADPLFLENAIVPLESSNESSARKLDNDRATIDTISPSEYDGVYFEPEPRRMPDPRATTVLKAEQCPLLWFHVYRLLEPEYIWPLSLCTSSSGKCHVCDSDSCICRVPADKEMSSTATGSRNLTSREAQTSKTSQLINKSSRSESSVFVPGKGGTAFIVQCSNENVSPKTNDHQYEERWLYNYLTANMSSLREIYQTYAEAFSSAPPKCDLCMSRLALWQLWRDCGIHDKGISLVQIDCYIAFNKSTFVEEKHNPFEKLEIWQFIHALLEVAWHIYTKYMDSETENIRGRLAGGLHKLLTIDILPNFGNHVGTLTSVNRNLLPLYAVFRLYESIGNPHTVLQFLRSTCIIKGTSDPEPKSWAPKITTFPDFLLDGRNVVTVGERVSYLPKEAPFNVPKVPKPVEKKDQDRLAQELFALRWLGAPRMVEVIAHVCPSIKDPQSGIIVNISYELTFLEFYEIILEASRRFLYARRIEEMKIEKQAEASAPDTALDENTTNGILQGNSNQHSAASKRSRPKKKFQ